MKWTPRRGGVASVFPCVLYGSPVPGLWTDKAWINGELFEYNGPKTGQLETSTTCPYPQNTITEPTCWGERVIFGISAQQWSTMCSGQGNTMATQGVKDRALEVLGTLQGNEEEGPMMGEYIGLII